LREEGSRVKSAWPQAIDAHKPEARPSPDSTSWLNLRSLVAARAHRVPLLVVDLT
jgi:hypothetical protein